MEGGRKRRRQTDRKKLSIRQIDIQKERKEGGREGEREVNKAVTGHRAGSAVKDICCASGSLGSIPSTHITQSHEL